MPCLSTRGYSHQSSPNRKVHTIIIYCSQISRGCTFLSWDDYHLVISFQLYHRQSPAEAATALVLGVLLWALVGTGVALENFNVAVEGTLEP